jgi:hypothetical protein
MKMTPSPLFCSGLVEEKQELIAAGAWPEPEPVGKTD